MGVMNDQDHSDNNDIIVTLKPSSPPPYVDSHAEDPESPMMIEPQSETVDDYTSIRLGLRKTYLVVSGLLALIFIAVCICGSKAFGELKHWIEEIVEADSSNLWRRPRVVRYYPPLWKLFYVDLAFFSLLILVPVAFPSKHLRGKCISAIWLTLFVISLTLWLCIPACYISWGLTIIHAIVLSPLIFSISVVLFTMQKRYEFTWLPASTLCLLNAFCFQFAIHLYGHFTRRDRGVTLNAANIPFLFTAGMTINTLLLVKYDGFNFLRDPFFYGPSQVFVSMLSHLRNRCRYKLQCIPIASPDRECSV